MKNTLIILLLCIGVSANAAVFDAITVEGAATLSAGTANTVPYLNASKVITSSTVSNTELGYLSGVTSAIQTQLGGKQSTLVNSAGLAAALSDETGTGLSVFSASPALSGNPTAPTQTAGDNSTKIATTAYADSAGSTAAANKIDGVASSVDSEVVLFSGTTGKASKRATGTGVGHLTSGVLSASPVVLTSEVSGLLPVANGGYTATQARTDLIVQTIINGDTTHSSSSDALFDALVLKEDLANKATDLTAPDNIKYPTTLAVSTAIAAAVPTGTGNSFAGFDNAGLLTSNFGWFYDDVSHGVRMNSSYDPVLGNATTNNFDLDFTSSASNGNAVLGYNFISRYDNGGTNFDTSRFDGASITQSHSNGNGHIDDMRSFFINQQLGNGATSGSVNQMTGFDVGSTMLLGSTVNNFLGQSIRFNQEGTINNDILMLDISTGGPSSPTANSNVRGLNINLQTNAGQDITGITLSNNKTAANNTFGFNFNDSGDSGGFIGIDISKNGNTTDPTRYSKGIQIDMNGTSANQLFGQSIGMGSSASGQQVVGLQVNVDQATSPNEKQSGDFNGGNFSARYDQDTSVFMPPAFSSETNVGGSLTIAAGFPILASPLFGNNLGTQIQFADDSTADNYVGAGNSLGFSLNGFVNGVVGTTGKTFDTINYMLAAGSNASGAGSVVNMNFFRTAGLLNAGGSLSVTNMRGFYVDPAFDGSVTTTNKWGFINASSSNNWFKGAVILGGTTGLPTGAFELDVTGTAKISGATSLGNGSTTTTQTAGDNSTKIATTAYVDAAAGASSITALTGDVTATGPGSVAATLATVNSNVGSFGSATNVATFTVNAKGLITAAGSTAIQIAESQVTNLTSDLALKAPLASPALTGVPTAPTATAGTNSTQIATTAYVDSATAAITPPAAANISTTTTLAYATAQYYYATTSGGAFTVTLPAASANSGKHFYVMNITFAGSNNVSVARTGTDLINAGTSDTITPGETKHYASNGTNWFVFN